MGCDSGGMFFWVQQISFNPAVNTHNVKIFAFHLLQSAMFAFNDIPPAKPRLTLQPLANYMGFFFNLLPDSMSHSLARKYADKSGSAV